MEECGHPFVLLASAHVQQLVGIAGRIERRGEERCGHGVREHLDGGRGHAERRAQEIPVLLAHGEGQRRIAEHAPVRVTRLGRSREPLPERPVVLGDDDRDPESATEPRGGDAIGQPGVSMDHVETPALV